MQSPFLGLEFAIWGLFLGLKFCSDFFWREILVRTFLGVDKKRNPGFLFLCQTIVSVSFIKERWTQKLSGIVLNYYHYFFLIVLFLGYVLGHWTFFGSNNFASFAHPRHQYTWVPPPGITPQDSLCVSWRLVCWPGYKPLTVGLDLSSYTENFKCSGTPILWSLI